MQRHMLFASTADRKYQTAYARCITSSSSETWISLSGIHLSVLTSTLLQYTINTVTLYAVVHKRKIGSFVTTLSFTYCYDHQAGLSIYLNLSLFLSLDLSLCIYLSLS
eukprot:scpid112853/ scgid18617/ 